MSNFFRQLRLTLLVIRVQSFARKANNAFKELLGILKRGEYVFAERQRAERDRAEFLEQNRDTQVDQNVARNTDNKRATRLKWLAFGLEGILSFKGLGYLLDQFIGPPPFILTFPLAICFAAFAIHGSILLNHFARRFRGGNLALFVFLIVASYALVPIIPFCNMLEAYQSNGGPDGSSFALALNWALVLITLFFHTSLVTMSNVFITAKNSKVALRELASRDNALRRAESEVRDLNNSFVNAKGIFSQKAREFVAGFKDLQEQNAQTAGRLLYLLDNFTIWMINNKVYQHQVVPYHANEQGQPVVETNYFDPKLNALVKGWDQLSSVTVYNRNDQDAGLSGTIHPAMELPDNGQQPDSEQNRPEPHDDIPGNLDRERHNGQDNHSGNDPMIDPTEPNPNDKVL